MFWRYLFGAGIVGIILNILVAGCRREPEAHGIPLEKTGKTFGFKASIHDPRPRVKEVLLCGAPMRPGPSSFSDKDSDENHLFFSITT
jgi:hypothetical protein